MAVARREVEVEVGPGADPAKAATLNRLRQAIAEVQAAPRRYLVTLSTGLAELDGLGAFRLGRGVELCGEEASGRASLAGRLVAGACREKRLSAWIDGPKELYPPALVDLGVELSRLLVVRPKAPKQLVWSAVQLLRSGAFTCVVLDVTHTGVKLSMLEAKKLVEAARTGGSLLVLLTSQAAPAQGLVRLELSTLARAEPALRGVEGPVEARRPELSSVHPELVEGCRPVLTVHSEPTRTTPPASECGVIPLRSARGGQYAAPELREAWAEVLAGASEAGAAPESGATGGLIEMGPGVLAPAGKPPLALSSSKRSTRAERTSANPPSGVEGRRGSGIRSVQPRSSTSLGLNGGRFRISDNPLGAGEQSVAARDGSAPEPSATGASEQGVAARDDVAPEPSATGASEQSVTARDGSALESCETGKPAPRALAEAGAGEGSSGADPAASGPSEAEVASWSARRTQAPPSRGPELAREAGRSEPEVPEVADPAHRELEATRAAAPEPITCFTVAHGSAAPPVRLVRARVVPRNAQRRASHLRERGLEPLPIAQAPSQQRQRTSLERNGYGMRHSRPGRDSAMAMPIGPPAPAEQPPPAHPERGERTRPPPARTNPQVSARAEPVLSGIEAHLGHPAVPPPASRAPATRSADAPVLLELRRFG